MRLSIPSLIGAFLFAMTTPASAGTLVLETTKGTVRIALLETLAPNHVARIRELAGDGFYDGIVFHPTGTGSGGSGKAKLKAEFSDYAYRSGTVGMARTSDPDSADSQFFICFDGCGHLTGEYTAWGQVEKGMEAVEALNAGEPPRDPDSIVRATVEE